MDAPILFVDDEEHLRLAAEQTFGLSELQVELFAGAEAALARISREFPGILVTDIRMSPMDGLELMRRVLEIDAEFPVILMTGHGDLDMAVQSMRDGAYDFLEKPYAPDRLVETVRRALEKRHLVLENRSLRETIGSQPPETARLVGRSAVMTALRQQIAAVAATDADVLIVGDTGTGKELAARAIHGLSERHDKPFVPINCAALPGELIESELFGHEAGAFPNAIRTRYGKFEHGRGGTIFLDEIDSLPQALQAKLLHVIENRQVTRLGSNDAVPLDVRVVAASKRDLEDAAAAGTFRSDLLYRLNVVTLRLPTLAERREDIPQLFAQFLSDFAARMRTPMPDPPGAVLMAVSARDWPGNVRELRNAAERYALGLDPDLARTDTAADTTDDLAARMAEHERALIVATLTAHSGSLKATYESLGLSRKALYEKMRKHGLDRAAFRDDA
ncbi:MAG: sigma-54 dependent transcriptional regulator [Pseudomonadota bacterium]